MRRYLDVRYDVTGLTDDEVGELAGEAHAQAERSDGHPSVGVESETVEVEQDEAAVVLNREAQDALSEELDVGPVLIPLVGNVIFEEDADALRLILGEADHGRYDDGMVWFSPYLQVFDPDDPGDGPLFVMYAGEDGSGATVYAPACGDADELERRLTRAFGDSGWHLDDHGEAVRIDRSGS